MTTLLPLDSPKWKTLRHSFGSASNVPDLIRALGDGSESKAADAAWEVLWGQVHHQGDVYDACFATFPHILRIALEGAIPCNWQFFAWLASVELERLKGNKQVGPDLLEGYEWALSVIPKAIERHAYRPWDHVFAQAACTALVVSRGQIPLAEALLELGPSVTQDFMKWHFGEA